MLEILLKVRSAEMCFPSAKLFRIATSLKCLYTASVNQEAHRWNASDRWCCIQGASRKAAGGDGFMLRNTGGSLCYV